MNSLLLFMMIVQMMDDHGGGVTQNEFYQISSVCKRMPKAHRDRERQLDSRHLRQIPTTK
jgi:hypothetical protein